MLVSDIMTLDPVCCTPERTAKEAARRMRQWCVGVLPVVADEQSGQLAGIVTDRDLCMAIAAEQGAAAAVTVGECMTRQVVCCTAGQPVERVMNAMREHRVRRLPVVDSAGHVLGIISLSDIVRYAALPEAEVVAAVSRICEPRGAVERRKQRTEADVNL